MARADIANLIQENIGPLVEVWVKAVRADETIQSDADLSVGGLIDHIPHLLEEICAVLRSGERPTIENTHEARIHAYTRFRQGYRARDLIRETSHLRTMLHDHVSTAALKQNGHADTHALVEALRTINLYIDEELRYAVAIYTEAIGSQTQTM